MSGAAKQWSADLEPAMKLILSCITKGEDQTRRVLDQLVRAGIAKHDVIVLHAGEDPGNQRMATPPAAPDDTSPPAGSTVGAAASGGVAGGMFGWIVGFGVLSIPGALLGGAVGAATGAAIGASQHMIAANHVPDEVHHHYASAIVDDHVAILVHVEDRQHYETTLMVFLDADGRHILTSRNNRVSAESDQIEALVHQPAMIDGPSQRPTGV